MIKTKKPYFGKSTNKAGKRLKKHTLNKRPWNKKGLIFTLDAIFALVIAVSLILGTLFFLSHNREVAFSRHSLDVLARDMLTVLEKDGNLKLAVHISSTSVIDQFLDNLPGHICADISLRDSADDEILSASKSGCTATNEVSVARRTFITNGLNTYVARMEVWHKEEVT